MRIVLSLLGFFVFSLFTYWQRNDMVQFDTSKSITIVWIMSYASVALLSLLSNIQPLPQKFFWLLASLPAVAAVIRFNSIDWDHGSILMNPHNPAGHETAGLIMMAIWIIVLGRFNSHDVMC